MGRLSGMRRWTGSAYTTMASGAVYGAGGELTSTSWLGYSESRTHNSLGQLTRMTATGTGLPTFDEEYIFSGTANNGRITQSKDWSMGTAEV